MKERVNPFASNALCPILGHRKSVLSRSDLAILHFEACTVEARFIVVVQGSVGGAKVEGAVFSWSRLYRHR